MQVIQSLSNLQVPDIYSAFRLVYSAWIDVQAMMKHKIERCINSVARLREEEADPDDTGQFKRCILMNQRRQ
jgi:hypothetical protein